MQYATYHIAICARKTTTDPGLVKILKTLSSQRNKWRKWALKNVPNVEQEYRKMVGATIFLASAGHIFVGNV